MPFDLISLPEYIAAVGAIGTAATGLVDTFKALPGGGLSRTGLKTIKQELSAYNTFLTAIPHNAAWQTIEGIWINGVALEDQKAKVKALIKLGFSPDNYQDMNTATNLHDDDLKALADCIANGTALTQQQVNVYGRLDAILSATLDAAYEKADQRYRNMAKFAAFVIAIVLSVIGAVAVAGHLSVPLFWKALAIGAIATPLAPVAKDITTAINTAVQASGQLRAILK